MLKTAVLLILVGLLMELSTANTKASQNNGNAVNVRPKREDIDALLRPKVSVERLVNYFLTLLRPKRDVWTNNNQQRASDNYANVASRPKRTIKRNDADQNAYDRPRRQAASKLIQHNELRERPKRGIETDVEERPKRNHLSRIYARPKRYIQSNEAVLQKIENRRNLEKRPKREIKLSTADMLKMEIRSRIDAGERPKREIRQKIERNSNLGRPERETEMRPKRSAGTKLDDRPKINARPKRNISPSINNRPKLSARPKRHV